MMGRIGGLKGIMFIEVFSTVTFISCSYPKNLIKNSYKKRNCCAEIRSESKQKNYDMLATEVAGFLRTQSNNQQNQRDRGDDI